MERKKRTTAGAADKLAHLVHRSLSSLPPSEREKGIRALEEAASEAGDSRARSGRVQS